MKHYVLVSAFIGLVFSAIFISGSLAWFIDIPSIIFVGGSCLIFYFKERTAPYEIILQNIGDGAICGGFTGLLVGLILSLGNIADISAIGPAVAVSLLTMFYAVLIKSITRLLIQKKDRVQNSI